MMKFLKTIFPPTHSSSMWRPMLTLSFASLAGMIILMVTIIWQMHSNIVIERKQAVRAQVISALAMVERIHTEQKQGTLSETEARQMAMTHLEAMQYPDSGYYWIIDGDGVMLMHPYSKDLVGKSAIDLLDAQGEPFVKKFLVTARSGGGFTRYDWPRPIGGDPASKIAYVVPFKPWNWVIGSGLYVDDLRAESVRQISLGAVLIFLLFSLNIGISLHLSRRFMREFHHNAIHDDLTNLFTRSHLHEVGSRMMYRANIEGGTPLAAIFLDLDYFKKINDDYGHKVGDAVLITASNMIRKGLRPNELAFRYGGEELAVLLHASEEDCYNIAERIRTTIKKHEFSIPGSKFKVTLSAGVAVARRDEALSDLLRRADQCMYMAKRSGRDRTVTESELDTPAHTG
jgi:diguanylate cyclase (GGDEF)-like protein